MPRLRRTLRLTFAGVASACALVACADLFGIHGGTTDGGGVIDSGGPDVPFDGGYVDPDANYADCGSGARSVSADAGFFVAQVGGVTTGSCTMDQPCKTIQQAVAAASQAGGGTIFIAPGTYAETLELDANSKQLSFQGGWEIADGGWVPQCTSGLATIAAAAGKDYVVHLANVPSTISFSLVKLDNEPLTVAPGESLYGVVSNNSTLLLTNVSIVVGKGGVGTADAGFNAGGGANCTLAEDGQNGTNGDAGAPGAISPGSDGFQCTGGAPGAFGTRGHNGTAPGNPPCISCPDQCQMTSAGSCDAGVLPICNIGSDPVCGGPGSFGCGGAAGWGGNGGGCGGSSVGLYVYQGTVQMTNGSITTNVGGGGGGGRAGGFGVDGGVGTPGINNTCYAVKSCSGFCYGSMGGTCFNDGGTNQSTVQGATTGGNGGNGGNGGTGGGGPGGNSYGCFGFDTNSTSLSGVAIQVGGPASGGAPNGTQGVSAENEGCP